MYKYVRVFLSLSSLIRFILPLCLCRHFWPMLSTRAHPAHFLHYIPSHFCSQVHVTSLSLAWGCNALVQATYTHPLGKFIRPLFLLGFFGFFRISNLLEICYFFRPLFYTSQGGYSYLCSPCHHKIYQI